MARDNRTRAEKLRALANDPGATEHERAAARGKLEAAGERLRPAFGKESVRGSSSGATADNLRRMRDEFMRSQRAESDRQREEDLRRRREAFMRSLLAMLDEAQRAGVVSNIKVTNGVAGARSITVHVPGAPPFPQWGDRPDDDSWAYQERRARGAGAHRGTDSSDAGPFSHTYWFEPGDPLGEKYARAGFDVRYYESRSGR